MREAPVIWGVLNVTPDSFSDGGDYVDLDRAVAHAHQMVAEGASVIDVGGESTRPGAPRVSIEEEQARVIPVIEALVREGVSVSVDTMNSSTAASAIERGVHFVNDVSGGLADPQMAAVVADGDVEYVAMHWRGHSDQMDALAVYTDVIDEVVAELTARVEHLLEAGVKAERLILDPGVGFAKTAQHNWAVLHGLSSLVGLGYRVLVGASRKRFLGELLQRDHRPADRDQASATVGVLAALQGAWGLRVHNVRMQREALDVWHAVSQGGH